MWKQRKVCKSVKTNEKKKMNESLKVVGAVYEVFIIFLLLFDSLYLMNVFIPLTT